MGCTCLRDMWQRSQAWPGDTITSDYWQFLRSLVADCQTTTDTTDPPHTVLADPMFSDMVPATWHRQASNVTYYTGK